MKSNTTAITEFPRAEERCISILRSYDHVVTEDLEIAFNKRASDGISTIARDVAKSLSSLPNGTTSSDHLGFLASSEFQRLVSPHIEDDLSKHARLLMETSLVLNGRSRVIQYAGYSIDELQHLQSYAGTRTIQGLEAALRNPFDEKLSAYKGQALFLTLFGITMVVANYCSQSAVPQQVTLVHLPPEGPC